LGRSRVLFGARVAVVGNRNASYSERGRRRQTPRFVVLNDRRF
jgi:hypothetical protein